MHKPEDRLVAAVTRIPVPGGKLIEERSLQQPGADERESFAVCLPAFSPDEARRDPE